MSSIRLRQLAYSSLLSSSNAQYQHHAARTLDERAGDIGENSDCELQSVVARYPLQGENSIPGECEDQ